MSRYNQSTINACIEVKLLERDENNGNSVWLITTEENLNFPDCTTLLSGANFTCKTVYDAEEDDVREYVRGRGILFACGINDADFERNWLDDDDDEEEE